VSLHIIMLPNVFNLSSNLQTLTDSGSELRMCCSSWSVVELERIRPCRLPTDNLPTSLVPPSVQWMTGMCLANRASNIE